MNKKQTKYIEDFLNIPLKLGVCPSCGDVQSHNILYCDKLCCVNIKYIFTNKTVFEAFLFVYNLPEIKYKRKNAKSDYFDFKKTYGWNCTYWKKNKISEKEYIGYIDKKIKGVSNVNL
jgi:hypothetical protein